MIKPLTTGDDGFVQVTQIGPMATRGMLWLSNFSRLLPESRKVPR